MKHHKDCAINYGVQFCNCSHDERTKANNMEASKQLEILKDFIFSIKLSYGDSMSSSHEKYMDIYNKAVRISKDLWGR